ncbi:tellurite resistance/C4-dicarboxylate transporter family protein [Salinicoccus kekensis]|uniref:Tellurite resistance protein TehA-like permease n=1 Tax=Salinicoccus kekensis TaxID=714307 RepID=A0A285UPN4_9STAP|nr:tellurite resistance/C4-dicarboxylate transporter family protein [Salinicoccus kekensis]SOC43830.1 tellurite resistance protein TehA-like permease [Salinicoccus kekensis]
MLDFLKRQSRHLFPGYFAMVMATGALSLSFWYLSFGKAAEFLIYLNVFIYIILLSLNAARIVFNTDEFLGDLASHAKGPGFFTLIAGTEVLGTQLVVINDLVVWGFLFWAVAFLLWIILMYTFFTLIIVKQVKPVIDESVNGGWLLVVVSTQSIAVLGTLISPGMGAFGEVILFISLCHFLLGCMLYINIISFIFYRLMFIKVETSSLTPPYWINMGALAITTLAGSVLIMYGTGFTTEIAVFLKGFTLFFWVLGTWWIPLLITLGIWRHVVNRHPLTYTPDMWGMAFPVAMYTVGTINLSQVLGLDFLMIIPYVTVFAATGVWLAVMAGMAVHHARRRVYYKNRMPGGIDVRNHEHIS